jgi:transcriptional regulator with PAS, ATPase and Fis domain
MPSSTMTVIRADALELPALTIDVVLPDGAVLSASLGVESVVVGTSGDCDLVVAAPGVSRRHCEISSTERGILVRDLGSKNGTFLGDAQLFEALIAPGATLSLGDAKVTVRVAGAPTVVPLSTSARFGKALGGSLTMRALFAKLEHAAKTPETILLLGESGTGKELLARAIHEQSPRATGPFVVFDCAAIVASLAEAELFGVTKGAFTGADRSRPGLFEQADGGTLFIDEIGELPIDLQPKLLRALESRTVRRLGASETAHVDVRVVAATHRDLRKRVGSGAFREDLYYRLAVVEVIVPPLRERRDDIALIVDHILAEHTPKKTLKDLPPNALDLLKAHRWPGNVRELRNTVARLVMFPYLGDKAIQEASAGGSGDGLGALAGLPLRQARDTAVEQFERAYLTAKLREHGGNITRASEAMGVTRQFVHRLLERYGIKASG